MIDLHTHSSASDGTDDPDALVRKAFRAGIGVLGLTDHDTVAGYADATAALPRGMTLVPGAEISCRSAGRSVHMLAYLFDPAEPVFAAERDRIRTDRQRRAREMVARLRVLGVPVEWDRVAALAAGGAVGRPHVARAMVELGVVPDVAAAFTPEWIGHHGRAYVPRYGLAPSRAVALVRGAGGVSVIAHPKASARGMGVPDELLEELAAAGLTGVEVDHPDQPEQVRRELRDLAEALDLVTTGASDYHGDNKLVRLAAETTTRDAYETLVAQAIGATPISA